MKKRILVGFGIIALVALLAGAAFVGGRLLNGQGLPGLSSGGPGLVSGGGNGGKEIRVNSSDIKPAKELPQISADVRGLFDHRDGNSFFIGTGRVTMKVSKDQSGNIQTSSNYDGPVVEIVVTAQTAVYQDVTMRQYENPPSEGQKIQQVVEPGTLDEIGVNCGITVWGRKTGERYIAEILVYTLPNFNMNK